MEYQYPQDFPQESRNKIEAAKLVASRKFDAAYAALGDPWHRWLSGNNGEDPGFPVFKAYVIEPFLVFAEEAAKVWPVDVMDAKCREFLRHFARLAYAQKADGEDNDWDDHRLAAFEHELEKMPNWKRYDDILLNIAQHQPSRQPRNTARARRTNTSKALPSASQARAKTVGKIINELRTIQPDMVNESQFDRVSIKHKGFLIFKVAQTDNSVRDWIENVQERTDIARLAIEIAARHCKRSQRTVESDWYHHKPHKQASK